MKAQAILSSMKCNICGSSIAKCDKCDILFLADETIDCKLYTHYCINCGD